MIPENSIFLPKNVPSSKNSKQIGFIYKPKGTNGDGWYFKKNGVLRAIQPSLRASDLTAEYIDHILPYIVENRLKFQNMARSLPKPLFIECLFVRDSKRAFDFHNAVQLVADCLTGSFWKEHKKVSHAATVWITDDNCSEVFFVPPSKPPYYLVDKEKAGVWLTVLNNNKQ